MIFTRFSLYIALLLLTNTHSIHSDISIYLMHRIRSLQLASADEGSLFFYDEESETRRVTPVLCDKM